MSESLIGTIIFEKYKVERLIGSGGSAEVYLCYNTKLNNRCVVKIISKKQQHASLMEEKTLLRLCGSRVPGIIDIQEDMQHTYIFQSYVEGITLNSLLKKINRVEEKLSLSWAMQLCDAIKLLHNNRPNPIIYRDMKPSNIIITPDDNAVLIDFGACIEHVGLRAPDKVIAGTECYCAPEQLLFDGSTDERTDVYGIGAVLCEMVTGQKPGDISKKFIEEQSYLAKETRSILIKCMEIEKINRYRDMEELRSSLFHAYKVCLSKEHKTEVHLRQIPWIIITLSALTYAAVLLGLR